MDAMTGARNAYQRRVARARRLEMAGLRMVEAVGRTLPGVERATRYDGAPVWRIQRVFLASMAVHASVEPGTLVVKLDAAERQGLLDDAPSTYYLTEYYRPHPVVLVRLAQIEPEALRDLLTMAARQVAATTRNSYVDDVSR